MSPTRPPGERGSASLLAVACLGVLLLVGCALGVTTALVRSHRVAQSAADLAALAAAAAPVGAEPCGRASSVAVANGARLVACRSAGRDVWVTVAVTGPRWLGQRADLDARAHAGPASAR